MPKHLITCALPYANGPLHFGHLAGVYLPGDIYTRHRRLQGHEVLHICGSDEHGVAIMLSAEKAGVGYQEWVDRWHRKHAELFKNFDIEFDVFGQTSAKYHEEEVLVWFKSLYEQRLIEQKSEQQLFCNTDQKYLPDRYVEGVCYSCSYESARGDECPNCGIWIDAIRLKKPVCKICNGSDIVVKETQHYYLMLTKMEKRFREWFGKKTDWRKLVKGFVNGLLDEGVVDRAITRDLEWGIDVPLEGAEGKKLYVWFDAPIGYVSNTRELLKGSKQDYLKDWWHNKDVTITHFIGKDNIIFHAYIFPCMSMFSDRVLPASQVPANEFLNLEGKQFSKSAGWYVDAEEALKEFGSDALRFYLCSIIPETGDSSFSWSKFHESIGDFGNKIGNFVHRALSFSAKRWPSGLPAEAFAGLDAHPEFGRIGQAIKRITHEYDLCNFTRALSETLALGQAANEFFHAAAPWTVIKTDEAAAARTLGVAHLYILAMATVLEPLVPRLTKRLRRHFSEVATQKTYSQGYQGNVGALVEIFSQGFKNPVKAEVLIPRVEAETIEKWRTTLGAHQ